MSTLIDIDAVRNLKISRFILADFKMSLDGKTCICRPCSAPHRRASEDLVAATIFKTANWLVIWRIDPVISLLCRMNRWRYHYLCHFLIGHRSVRLVSVHKVNAWTKVSGTSFVEKRKRILSQLGQDPESMANLYNTDLIFENSVR